MAFELLIDKRAEEEIEDAILYLLTENKSTLKKFVKRIDEAYKFLSENPFNQIRYDEIRCLPIKGFPYMFHYSINEKIKTVHIHGFIHTSQNPDEHWIK